MPVREVEVRGAAWGCRWMRIQSKKVPFTRGKPALSTLQCNIHRTGVNHMHSVMCVGLCMVPPMGDLYGTPLCAYRVRARGPAQRQVPPRHLLPRRQAGVQHHVCGLLRAAHQQRPNLGNKRGGARVACRHEWGAVYVLGLGCVVVELGLGRGTWLGGTGVRGYGVVGWGVRGPCGLGAVGHVG